MPSGALSPKALAELRGVIANEAFSDFDFGPYQVEETSGWQYLTGSSDYFRIVFVRHESAAPNADTTTQTFSVVFKENSADIYAMGIR